MFNELEVFLTWISMLGLGFSFAALRDRSNPAQVRALGCLFLPLSAWLFLVLLGGGALRLY
jgi:hypothetical protein